MRMNSVNTAVSKVRPLLALVLAMTMLTSNLLTGCGTKQDAPAAQNGGSTGAAAGDGGQAADGEAIETVKDLVPWMIWGKYERNTYEENPDGTLRADLKGFMKDMQYEMYGDKEYSVLPYTFYYQRFCPMLSEKNMKLAGEEIAASMGQDVWDRYLTYNDYMACSVRKCDKQGQYIIIEGVGKVENGKLLISWNWSYDENTLTLTADNWEEYEVGFRGKNLILQRGQSQVELPPGKFTKDAENNHYALAFDGYVEQAEMAYQGIAGICYFQKRDPDAAEESNARIQFLDGGFSIDPVIELTGENTMKLSWQEA